MQTTQKKMKNADNTEVNEECRQNRGIYLCFVCILHLLLFCLHSTFTSVLSAFYISLCVVCILHLPLCCLHSTVTSVLSAFYIYLCFVCILHLPLFFLHSTFTSVLSANADNTDGNVECRQHRGKCRMQKKQR
jgi:predicted PurR-regulated permease PerM